MKVKLSPKQQQIVDHVDGPILVKASAGSGKTRVLTERVKKLSQMTKRKILAITFTNKAGEEMKERIGRGEKDDQLFIGTFHGFCQSVIENNRDSLGFSTIPHIFEDESDRLKMVEEAIKQNPIYFQEYSNMDSKMQKKYLTEVLNYISEEKRNLKEYNKISIGNDKYALLYQTYQEFLFSQNAIDFDDLIILTYNLFINNKKIAKLYRRSFKYICIDEAQDLNYSQYNLILALSGKENNNIMMVGDPNQSIFAFNGSSSRFMTDSFRNDFNPTIYELNENFRSSIKVLEAAEKIYPNSSNLKNTVISGAFSIQCCENEFDEAKQIITKILYYINIGHHEDIEGQITYDKISVLARNKYIFKILEKELIKRNIPYYYKVTPGGIVFESKIMKIFDLSFRIKINPLDKFHMKILSDLCQIDEIESLDELLECTNDNNINTIITIVKKLKEDGSNIKLLLEEYKKSIEKNDIIQFEDKSMIINDLEELLTHWHEYARKTENKNIMTFRNSMSLGKTHPLTKKEGIALSTIHTMKGQEYDIVFLMGMDDGTFPDYRAIQKGGIELEQEKNNLYVAITRSKRFLTITWPQFRTMSWGEIFHRSHSRFLNVLMESM